MIERYVMQIEKMREAGYDEALYGISLSYKDRAVTYGEWWTHDRYKRMQEVAAELAHKDGGHNKFLRCIQTWWSIEAPRYWWQEFDTYTVGVVRLSESTMHTLGRRDVSASDIECENISDEALWDLNEARDVYEMYPSAESFAALKGKLPEGYLQQRLVCMNYQALRNIILQRRTHRLPHWHAFIRNVLAQVEHPELLPEVCVLDG